ncbi:Subtilase family protein isoform 1 [Hibiscus syriacus]|uniref:Subtilase family protein isoform 1 n=1 Tax=Hibiscus syriacus TaxID=106335 RepID=A0A6A3C1L3_HIBSY|nr:Subtilase family protein isoform 1 [Hibiscus syriacus]
MKSTVVKIFDAVLLLLAFITAVLTVSTDKQTYIVHMDKAKITDTYNTLVDSKPWHQAVLDSLADDVSSQEESQTTPPELLYSYETSFSGFAAKLSGKQFESLKMMEGFVSAVPNKMLSPHTTRTPQFLELEGKKGLWSSSDIRSDVIIGVVDTGIWPEHVSFHDHGLPPVSERWFGACEKGDRFSPSNCNRKLIGARYFYGGNLAAGGVINGDEDYISARDIDGHGTHTASTAAGAVVEHANLYGLANGSAAGMRYTARIAAYKVCWPGCSTVDTLMAMVKAIEDGVDVLSLSLGSPLRAEPYYQDYLAIASYYAFKSGIFVTFSAGNRGPRSYTVVNTAPWIMTVASSTVDRSFPAIVKLGNDAEYCVPGSLNPKLVNGKLVICQQGMVQRIEMGEEVKLAGGAGMLIMTPQGEDPSTNVHVLPAVMLGALASEAVLKYVNTTKGPIASIVFKTTTYGTRAPKVATSSSRGPNSVGLDVIKPDVTAPGVNILAAWPAETSPSRLQSDNRRVLFNIISGTSMACPHVSGIAALIKSKHKDWSPAAIKSALMTTAYTMDNRGKPIKDLAFDSMASPFVFVQAMLIPSKLLIQIALFEEGFRSCPMEAATMQPGDLNYPSFAVNFKRKAQNVTVTYKRTVTNVGIPRSTYKVSVEVPKGVSVTIRPKVLSFKKMNEEVSYKVSFIGLSRKKTVASSSFGSLVWVSGKYRVRSPIAVTWK